MRHAYLLACIAVPVMALAQSAPPPATPADAKVSAATFAMPPGIDGARLSPDGTQVAGKMVVGGRQVLVVVSLFEKDKPPAMIGVGDTVDINDWRWVGDKWLAVGVGAQDMLYGEQVYVTRLLGISADMKTVNRINWQGSGVRADDVIWSAHDGTPRLLLSRQSGISDELEWHPQVVEVDLSTGRTRLVARSQKDVWNWYADGQGNVRIGLRYQEDRRKRDLLYRASNAEPFRTIASVRGDGDGLVVPLTFRRDGTAIAFDDTDGRDAVYEVSLPDLKLGRKLYGVERYDVDSIVDNPTEDDVDGVRVTDRYGHVVWLNPTMKALQDMADKAVGDRRARIVSWDASRRKFLLSIGSPSQAGALYYWDSGTNKMQRFAWQNDELKGRSLSPVSTIRYSARDGTEIEAVLTLPRGRAAKDLPLIVMPHGGPFARDAESWDWWTQYLAERGYAVVQPNYRGSSGYGTAFAKLGEGQWGLKMQDDLNDAVTELARQGIADPKRVCMVGASYGGYAAMRAAQRDGGLYRCAVSYAGVSDLQAMQRYDGKFLYGKTAVAWLKKQAPDYRAVSPRFGAAGFGTPILIMHGKLDRRVPVAQSRMMAAALKDAGKPYTYVEQPLGDHHFTRTQDRLQFLETMGAFIDKHNPA